MGLALLVPIGGRGEAASHHLHELSHSVGQREDDGVGAGIKGVGYLRWDEEGDTVSDGSTTANQKPCRAGAASWYLGASVVGVEAVCQGDDVPRKVVEVEDGGEGVEAGGVELVAVPHGELPEALEVPLTDVPHHQGQAFRHHRLCPVLPWQVGHGHPNSVTPTFGLHSDGTTGATSPRSPPCPPAQRNAPLREKQDPKPRLQAGGRQLPQGRIRPVAPYLQQGAGVHAGLHPRRAAHLLLLPTDLGGMTQTAGREPP